MRQVPAPRARRPPSAPRPSPTPRAAASAAAPRSTAASGTGCPTTSPTSGGARTRSTSSRPTPSTATPTRVEGAAQRRPRSPERRRRRRRVLERGATKLGWRNVEFARVFRYDAEGRGTKQTMSRTLLPRAVAAGAHDPARLPRVVQLRPRRRRASSAPGAVRTHPGGGVERLTITADHVFVCGGAVQTPALLQRSGIRRNIGNGLKLHPTVKIAARFPAPARPRRRAHAPHHRVRAEPHHRRLGQPPGPRRAGPRRRRRAATTTRWPTGRTSRLLRRHPQRGQRAGASPCPACGRRSSPTAHRRRPQPPGPRPRPPRRGAARRRRHRAVPVGRRRLGRPPRRRARRLVGPGRPRARTNLMTVHLTSTRAHGRGPRAARAPTASVACGATRNLRVNDASLLPDAPGVNPQAAIMAIAARNADHFLAERDRRPPGPGRPDRHRRLGPTGARDRADPADVPRPTRRTAVVTGASGWLGRTWSVPSSGTASACAASSRSTTTPRRSRCCRRRSRSSSATSATRRPPTGSSTASAGRHRVPRRRGHPPRPRRPASSSTSTSAAPSSSLDRARRAGAGAVRARVVELAVRRQPDARRPLHRGLAVRPVPRLRAVEARGRAARAAQATTAATSPTVDRPRRRGSTGRTSRRGRRQFFRTVRRGRFPLVGDGTQRRSMVVHRQPRARPAPGRGRRRGARAAPTGSPTPSPTSCATSSPPCAGRWSPRACRRLGPDTLRLPARRRRRRRAGRRRCSRAAGRYLQARARARRAQGHHRLRHLAGPRRARATTRPSTCSRACGPASAGASSTGSSSDGAHRPRHRGQRLLRHRSSPTMALARGDARPRPRPQPARPTTPASSTSPATSATAARCGRRARASTSCSTTSPRCRWPRTASCSGRST